MAAILKIYFSLLVLNPKANWLQWGGRVVRRCCVSYITGASNWYWLTVVGKGRGGMFLFLLFLHFHSSSSFFPVPLSSPLRSLLSLFSLSLGDNTKWPSRVDMSLNPNTINQLTPNSVGSIEVTYRSKVAKIVPIGNPWWPPWWPSWKSIFCFFSWTERPVDSKLGRKHRGDL